MIYDQTPVEPGEGIGGPYVFDPQQGAFESQQQHSQAKLDPEHDIVNAIQERVALDRQEERAYDVKVVIYTLEEAHHAL